MNVTTLAPGQTPQGAHAMSIAPDDARRDTQHLYRTMREFVQSMDDTLPGKFEITKEGIVHDMMSPVKQHELTALRLRKRLEGVMPDKLVAHTGTPDVEDAPEGVMRHPDVMLISEADMEGDGSFDPRTLIAAIEIVSRSNPDNDWVGKMRDYPLLGIPVYAIFDPRTGTGAVLSDIHPTPAGPATRPARTSSTARTSPSPSGPSPPIRCPATHSAYAEAPRFRHQPGVGREQLKSQLPDAYATKFAHVFRASASWGPPTLLESRTWTALGAIAISTQESPSLLLL